MTMRTEPAPANPGWMSPRNLLIGGAAIWCAAIVAAPLLDLHRVYDFFSAICHQNPDRSWSLAGEPLGVCIRCASIYFGFLGALAVGALPNSRLLRAALAAALIEFLAARAGFDFAATRAATGLFLGLAAAGFVEKGVTELIRGRISGPFAGASQ